MQRKVAVAAALAWLGLLAHGLVLAQGTYPNKPIRWVVPYAAGGGTDVIARPIAQKLGDVLGQPVLYDNRGGGGGLIAGEFVAKSAPDGYTLLVGSGNTHTTPTLLFDKLAYDPVKDYAPITNFVIVPNVLAATANFPPRTAQDLVAFGKANPGKINWASAGNGGGSHLALVLFAQQAGIKVTHVPYKGAGPAVTAMLGGESDLLFALPGVFLAHFKAGKLRPVGLAALTRIPMLADVPTLHESGMANFESNSYYGLLAPAATPRPIITRLNQELVKIIRAPDMLEKLAAAGAIAVADTPEQFSEMLRQDVAKWGRIIREHNIKPD